MFVARCHHRQKHQRQHGKNQRLNYSDNKLQKHKWYRHDIREYNGHGAKQYFARKNISEQSE